MRLTNGLGLLTAFQSMSFNSLFEMRRPYGVINIRWWRPYLSILYLRCRRVKRGASGLYAKTPFNSLFEMRRSAPADATSATTTLSILYLRCSSARYRLYHPVVMFTFNSLFEMPSA